MAEENESEHADREFASAGGAAGPDAMAVNLAMNGDSEEARDFLRNQGILAAEQTALVRLQAKEIAHELSLRHWSLRVRHISDVMKLAFEFAAAFILVAAAIFLGGAIWSAAQDKSLVIDAFDVPPDLAGKGLSGEVIAGRIEDQLRELETETDSIRMQSSYRQSWGNDIKVQIPDTGVSIGELYRDLVAWLGHESHIAGSVWHTPQGLVLSVRVGDAPAVTLTAPDDRTDALIARAAENLYAQTEPYRHAVYLLNHNREVESTAALRDLALHGPAEERVWAYTMWGQNLLGVGDVAGGLEKSRIAAEINSDLPNVMFNVAGAEALSGNAEEALHANERALKLFQGPSAVQLSPYAVASQIPNTAREIDESLGDFRSAADRAREVGQRANYDNSQSFAPIFAAADLAAAHDLGASRRAYPNSASGESDLLALIATDDFNLDLMPLPFLARAISTEDWATAKEDLQRLQRAQQINIPSVQTFVPVLIRPLEAYVDARLGLIHDSRAVIDKTARDCYLCVRMRGNIDAAQKNWDGAAYWFAEAVRQAPSTPFAYADWGKLLLHKGDYDGAIVKFREANLKGPHFADPLEMWGEALMQQNRSDLALAKFAEANNYAPNWGRLHLEWGKALFYAGRKDEAQKQFNTARDLDLSTADRAELKKWPPPHA